MGGRRAGARGRTGARSDARRRRAGCRRGRSGAQAECPSARFAGPGAEPMRAAAIDIGTNSTRLLVAEVERADGPLVTLDRRMTITRLGRGVDASRRLAPDAIARTVD